MTVIGRRAAASYFGSVRTVAIGGLGADLRRTEARDRLEQALAVTKQYPNLTEIVFRQVGQNIHADGVISKLRLVLAEIEASQPIPDVDDRSSIGCRRS